MINGQATHTKTVVEVVDDLRHELIDFVTTRFEMLEAEIDEKVRWAKSVAPVLVVGVVLLGSAWLALTGFLVCIIAEAYTPHPWAWTLSFLTVAVLYAVVGGSAAYLAWRELKTKGVKPERTIRVLKEDSAWLRAEARTQL